MTPWLGQFFSSDFFGGNLNVTEVGILYSEVETGRGKTVRNRKAGFLGNRKYTGSR
jgi:hypothetical protein